MSLLRPFRALLAAVRRLFGRRRARRLRALGLPSAAQAVGGLLPGPRPDLPLALRTPGPLEPPPGSSDHWALPLGAQAIRQPGSAPRLLLRLSGLPPPLRPLERLRLERFRLDEAGRPSAHRRALSAALARPLRSQPLLLLDALARHTLRLLAPADPGVLQPRLFGLDQEFAPARLAESAPLERATPTAPPAIAARRAPALVDLGAAQPARFGLDDDGRTNSEREPLVLAGDRPARPPAGHWLRRRAPPSPAQLSEVRFAHLRLDPATGAPANQGIIEGYVPPPRAVFLLPAFDRELCQPRWMARTWILFLSARPVELFAWWWIKQRTEKAGAADPVDIVQPEEISYSLFHHNKEQMLIRRDVIRDQEGPGLSTFEIFDTKPQILAHARLKRLDQLIPKKQWVEIQSIATGPVFDESRPAFDAYVQWRTLVNGLEER